MFKNQYYITFTNLYYASDRLNESKLKQYCKGEVYGHYMSVILHTFCSNLFQVTALLNPKSMKCFGSSLDNKDVSIYVHNNALF